MSLSSWTSDCCQPQLTSQDVPAQVYTRNNNKAYFPSPPTTRVAGCMWYVNPLTKWSSRAAAISNLYSPKFWQKLCASPHYASRNSTFRSLEQVSFSFLYISTNCPSSLGRGIPCCALKDVELWDCTLPILCAALLGKTKRVDIHNHAWSIMLAQFFRDHRMKQDPS